MLLLQLPPPRCQYSLNWIKLLNAFHNWSGYVLDVTLHNKNILLSYVIKLSDETVKNPILRSTPTLSGLIEVLGFEIFLWGSTQIQNLSVFNGDHNSRPYSLKPLMVF